MKNTLLQIADFCEGVNRKLGQIVSWLALALVLITVYDVSLRYLFLAGSVRVQELEWHIFSLFFLLGAGATLADDSHVRVDIFYSKFSPRVKALIDVLGCSLLLLPFCSLLIWSAFPFIVSSYEMGEISQDPGGLPYRFLLKGMIPVSAFLLILQGIAQLIKNLLLLFGVISKVSEPSSRVNV